MSAPRPGRSTGVILSAGVNDLAFGPLLSFLRHAGGCRSDHPVRADPGDPFLRPGQPHHGVLGGKLGLHAIAAGPDRIAAEATSGPLRRARRRVAPGNRLERWPGRRDGDVYITQYPDFTNGDNGTPCGPYGIARFATSTWTWLGLNALQLNRTVANAASGNGWTLARGNSAAFATRGYCASKSLFVGIVAALRKLDAGGPFHPNAEAHQIQAAEVEPLLCKGLGLSSTCTDS